jgi:hypothetical protein
MVVGDIFEVMAQVDRRLTKVNSDDPIIRVNDADENLGRHRRRRQGMKARSKRVERQASCHAKQEAPA